MSANPVLTIRPALEADVPLVLRFIRGLADYEHLSHLVTASTETLHDTLFGARPAAEVLLAFEVATPVAFALFFHTFSTFLGRRGLWLEDIYVDPAFRRKGYGRALLLHVARIAHERGCGRFEWSALDWNTPAIEFYQGLGAVALNEWTIFRVTGEALQKMATME